MPRVLGTICTLGGNGVLWFIVVGVSELLGMGVGVGLCV